MEKVRHRAEDLAEERILDILLPSARTEGENKGSDDMSSTRQKFRKKLREGELDDREIEVELIAAPVGVEIMAPPGMEEMSSQLSSMFQNMAGNRTKKRHLPIKQAYKLMRDEEASKLINEEEIKTHALQNLEQNGIVFLDEIDKIARRSDHNGPDVSREGVQRDLLPLVEGCTVTTKFGVVNSDHILFIASGAFHLSKPSDLIPELQGRLPIRVELEALTVDDFVRILTETDASLTEQYQALMNTEDLRIEFTEDGIARIAEIAWQVNERTENIGARRLHTVIERVMETLSFEAPDMSGKTAVIDAAYVNAHLDKLVQDEDLSRYIL